MVIMTGRNEFGGMGWRKPAGQGKPGSRETAERSGDGTYGRPKARIRPQGGHRLKQLTSGPATRHLRATQEPIPHQYRKREDDILRHRYIRGWRADIILRDLGAVKAGARAEPGSDRIH